MNVSDAKSKVVSEFRLEALMPPVNVEFFARKWGVNSVERQPISSSGMLLLSKRGYKIILNERHSKERQRFSLAHELGHLLLQKCGISGSITDAKYRDSDEGNVAEERLCDQIAAEILMPRMAFCEDGWMEGWSLKSLRTLSGTYDTSLLATAVRMVDLMPEEALMGVWKVNDGGRPTLQWPHAGNTAYAIPSPSIVSDERMDLIGCAWNSLQIEEGTAPVRLGRKNPIDVPVEAMSWGRGEYKQVMAFYYPTRHPSSPV